VPFALSLLILGGREILISARAARLSRRDAGGGGKSGGPEAR
jgi:hypothetical protein